MSPMISDGDFVIYLAKILPWQTYEMGDLVVLKHAQYGTILKRIVQVMPNKNYRLKSDHPTGISTKEIGVCSKKTIKGRVIYWTKT